MKRTIEMIVVLLVMLLFAFYTAAQVNDQPPRPTSPEDGVAPTEEINAKSEQQPITLKAVSANLRDNQGSPIGRIEDLIIDPSSGRIEFLIISAYFPTNSMKLTPIPWKAVSYRADQSGMGGMPGANQVFALNFPRTKLQQAPTFERYRWPDMSQTGWRQPIYEFYATKDQSGLGGTGDGAQKQTGAGRSVGPNTSTGPIADPSVPSGINRTNSTSLRTNALPLPRIPTAPGINPLPNSRTNLPAGERGNLRNQPSTPDNRLPIGTRL